MRACSGEPTELTMRATDLWVDGAEVGFTIVGGPEHGVLTGELPGVVAVRAGTVEVDGTAVRTLGFGETAEIGLRYTSAVGFTGRDEIRVRASDAFGNSTSATADVGVVACVGHGEVPVYAVKRGELLPIIVPEGFDAVVGTAWRTVVVVSLVDGTERPEALSVRFSEAIDRYVIYLDTGRLPIGRHLVVIPLGNGETVELTIHVEAGEGG